MSNPGENPADNPPADAPTDAPENPPADPPKQPADNPAANPIAELRDSLDSLPERLAGSVKEVLDGWQPPQPAPVKPAPVKREKPADKPEPAPQPTEPGKKGNGFVDWWFGR